MTAAEFEPMSRELCPDEACIGLIGADGRCKECGRVGTSAHTHSRNRGLRVDSDDGGTPDTPGEPDSFADRRLCPDDACIGVLDAAGRCQECGKVASEGVLAVAVVATVVAQDAAAPAADDPFADRELCPDGACIGVLGAGGRCKVCGQPGPPRA
jgi:hypothetical protein